MRKTRKITRKVRYDFNTLWIIASYFPQVKFQILGFKHFQRFEVREKA